MDELLFDRFFNSSLKFLSYRPRSEKEVKDNLIKKSSFAKASEGQEKQKLEEIIERVIERLKELKFIDDKEFVAWFVRSRIQSKPKASKVIKMELKQKGIAQEIIDDLPLTIDDLENAKKLLEKKIARYKDLGRDEIYNKLGGFLARRGYNFDTVKRAIDESFGK